MTATCPTHAAPSTGTCERCGTFFCEQCRVDRLCTPCSRRPAEQQPRRFAMASLVLFGLGFSASCFPLGYILTLTAIPLGLALGVVSLFREPGARLIAAIGVTLNAIPLAAFLFVGFAAGWRA